MHLASSCVVNHFLLWTNAPAIVNVAVGALGLVLGLLSLQLLVSLHGPEVIRRYGRRAHRVHGHRLLRPHRPLANTPKHQALTSRASNEPSRGFHTHGEDPRRGLLCDCET